MSISTEHEQVLMSLRTEYRLILRWFMFVQGARLVVILAFLSAQGLLFNGLYAVIKYMQASSHHPVETTLFPLVAFTALVFNYATYQLLNIVTKGIFHVLERGVQVEIQLGLPNALFSRAVHEHTRRTKEKMPPGTVDGLVCVTYNVLNVVWGVILTLALLVAFGVIQ